MSSRILVIGESCKDVFYYGKVNRLCPEAPVPVFKVVDSAYNGGMAKNVESNLLSLGNNVDLLTNDNWREVTKTRYVHADSNHMFLRVDNNDDQYEPLSVELFNEYDLTKYDAVVVSDYNKGFLTEDMLSVISVLHNLVFIDTKKILGPWAENFDFIKVNSKEYDLTKHTINDKINNKLIVTRGPLGCSYREKMYSVPKVEIKDTSGAGDTFISGLCSEFCKTGDIDASINFANECATRVVQRKGVSIV